MKVAVIGTGYVGLVTGVCLAEVGHSVTCIDMDTEKIERLKRAESPIYEPGIEEMIIKNLEKGNLFFSSELAKGIEGVDVIYIAVGTPALEDGRADLSFVERVAKQIGEALSSNAIIVIKSTVPVGTNHHVKQIIQAHLKSKCVFDVVSNPEFLREGSAIHDTFRGDRIIIGADKVSSGDVVAALYKSFGIEIIRTDVRSAEMIKYASNAFLATKISFINEIANICEEVGANIQDVALGMGKDSRIGDKFLNAGIGYGGSCFPKDTKALVQIASNLSYDFDLLNSVISVNNNQQSILVDKMMNFYETLKGKTIAVLGLAFKPNTDDIREAASLKIIDRLRALGCSIKAFDPVAIDNAIIELGHDNIEYHKSIEETLSDADCAVIVTEWDQVKSLNLDEAHELLKEPVIFDGRNCFSLEKMRNRGFTYISIGRAPVYHESKQKNENDKVKV